MTLLRSDIYDILGQKRGFLINPSEKQTREIEESINILLAEVSDLLKLKLSIAFLFLKNDYFSNAVLFLWDLPVSIERNIMLSLALEGAVPASAERNEYIQSLLETVLSLDDISARQEVEAELILERISDLCS